MNRHNGLWSSEVVTVATGAFALSMLATWGQTLAGYSFGFCMILSWSFVVLACAMAAISRKSLRAAALVGVGFAGLYSGFVATVVSKPDWWFKVLLIGHGVFAPFCVMAPILNFFSTMSKGSGEGFAIIALTTWCLYFGPTAVLACFHFKAYQPVADTFVQSAPALQTPS